MANRSNPTDPDVTDFLATESAQEVLEGARLQWEAELVGNKRLNRPARERILDQRMQSLKEELIADRPDQYLDQTELAHRYHRFPKDSLAPAQRKAVEAVYGQEPSFLDQRDVTDTT